MNSEQILDAIGTINDEAIADARAYQRPKSWRLVKWSAMAACLTVVLFTAFSILPIISASKVLHLRTIRTE